MIDEALANLTALGDWVWRTSLQASAAIVLVAALQALLRRRLPARWTAALWLVVLLRLALPWAPESSLSLYRWLPRPWRGAAQKPVDLSPQTGPIGAEAAFDPWAAPERIYAQPLRSAGRRRPVVDTRAPQSLTAERMDRLPAGRLAKPAPAWRAWLSAHPYQALWMAGALGLVAALAVRTARFTRRVRRRRPVTDGRWLNLLEDCKAGMRVHAPVSLVEADCVHGPMILGFIRPRLLLPQGMLGRLTAEQARCIFLHELAHIRRHDILLGWVMALLLALHWFNPLVWLASLRLRADREVACDAEALDHLPEGERKEYGRTLVRLAEELSSAPLMPTMAGIAEHKLELERRILMITRFKRPMRLSSLLGAALLALAGACILTAPLKAQERLRDKIDYPFANDPAAVGIWAAVDFVETPDKYVPGLKKYPAPLFLLELHLQENGVVESTTGDGPSPPNILKWTRGLVLNSISQTASRYEIRKLGGELYMFLQWKSGDYTIRHQTPHYYVLKWAGRDTGAAKDVRKKPVNEPRPQTVLSQKLQGPTARAGAKQAQEKKGDGKQVASKQEQSGKAEARPTPTPPRPVALGIQKHPEPANFSRPIKAVPSYNPDSEAGWQVDLRSRDLSGLNLLDQVQDLMYADFDSKTQWPKQLREYFDPSRIMDLAQPQALGLRKVHAKGITGKGVGLAIIDQNLLVDHAEYKDRLRHYEEIHWPEGAAEASLHGAAVASIAVGRSVGVAPGADLYYIAQIHGQRSAKGNDFDWDFTWLAQSIDRVLEINRALPEGKKIRVISISVGWSPEQKGYPETMAAVARAKKEGVFIVSSSLQETNGLSFHGLGRAPLSDPDLAESYEPGLWWRKRFFSAPESALGQSTLLVPMDSRCTASPTGEEDEVFYRQGGWSWSIPYIAGLYALACQATPDVTPERFWKAALETGVTVEVNQDGMGRKYPLGKIAQPKKLLEKLAAK